MRLGCSRWYEQRYRDNDAVIFRALVLCANKGNVEARDALDTLARTWAELHAEVDW